MQKTSGFLKHLAIKNCIKHFVKAQLKIFKTTFPHSGSRHYQVKKVKKVKDKNVYILKRQ